MKLNLILSEIKDKSKTTSLLYRGTNIINCKKNDLVKLFIYVDSFPIIKSYQREIIESIDKT